MFITDLPEDVIILIVKKLDLKSINNLYESSQHLGRILSIPGVIKEWQMSLNSMATVQSFKLNFFKDVAGHLQVLNICGVVDVCKTTVMPALRRLKNLKTLDISYTDVDLLDFFDMYDACPSIKNLCINFSFEKRGCNLSESVILRGQNIFEKMENVHFVGTTTNLLYSDIARYILQKANLNTLKYTIIHQKTYGPMECEAKYEGIVKFKQMYVYFMNLEVNYGSFRDMPIFNKFNSTKYEFIIIANGAFLDVIEVYVTPIFIDFFREKFRINAKCLTDFNNDLTGNMGIMIFNKEYTCFNDTFFLKLFRRLNDCFPVFFVSDSQSPVPDNYNWFYTTPAISQTVNNKNMTDGSIEFKKKRIGNPNFVLDYDEVFKRKTRFKLSLAFTVNYVNPVSLSPSCDFLSKITFLSLSGTVRYAVEFFNVLFRCCGNLETLDIVAPSISPCVSPISRSIPLSKTLKNLRLIDRRFDYNTFFQSLSQCKTLENIHLLDRSPENTSLADPSTLFKNCDNLYSLCIKACMSNETKRKMTRIFNNAKSSLKKYQLDIKLCQIFLTHDRDGFNYEPYIDVFNVYPIKPGLSFLKSFHCKYTSVLSKYLPNWSKGNFLRNNMKSHNSSCLL